MPLSGGPAIGHGHVLTLAAAWAGGLQAEAAGGGAVALVLRSAAPLSVVDAGGGEFAFDDTPNVSDVALVYEQGEVILED